MFPGFKLVWDQSRAEIPPLFTRKCHAVIWSSCPCVEVIFIPVGCLQGCLITGTPGSPCSHWHGLSLEPSYCWNKPKDVFVDHREPELKKKGSWWGKQRAKAESGNEDRQQIIWQHSSNPTVGILSAAPQANSPLLRSREQQDQLDCRYP